ncbi:MAG: AgmX/PglI C-terminal domain-containing protein [Kofleriaceae bacterium]
MRAWLVCGVLGLVGCSRASAPPVQPAPPLADAVPAQQAAAPADARPFEDVVEPTGASGASGPGGAGGAGAVATSSRAPEGLFAEIRQVLRSRYDALASCYARPSSAPSGSTGDVGLRLDIDANGRVTANVTGVEPQLARCIEDAIAGLQVSKPPDGHSIQVSYPYR